MTRKEELEERVEKLASRFERIGESQAKYEIVEALLQVEREVLQRVQRRYHHHEYMSDFKTFDEWLTAQQQEHP